MATETLMHNTQPLGALLGDASDIIFDNGGTDLTSDNVEDAIKELTDADNIQYDSNTSVKEAIDGVVVKSIPANTYNTYALALAELETYFNALTFSEKLKAKIVRSDSIVFFSQAIADKIFAMPNVAYSSGSRVLAQTIDLNNHTYITATIASGGVSVNDVSSSAQALKLELIV